MSCSEAAGQSALRPTYLRCEYRIDPLGIDVVRPRLSWVLESPRRAERQTAYQIIVVSNERSLHSNKGDLWDSGKVASDETAQIVYAGKRLASEQQCFWKVRVWDRDGNPSAWSKLARWTMGLLARADWKAKWIGFDSPAPYIRKEVSIGKPIRSAFVHASALGLYELHINGKRVGRDYFTPGNMEFRKRIYYNTYEVTKLLNAGDNAIGAILGDGWYAGYLGFTGKRRWYGGDPRLLVRLSIEYQDGTKDIIATDETWKASDGPILEADMLMGCTYDARREMPGWDGPGFDDSTWHPVLVSDHPNIAVEAKPDEPVRRFEEIRPEKITEPKPGVYVFDLKQNMVGWVRLKVSGQPGQQITVRHAEVLNPDGTIYTANLRAAKATDIYYLKGKGEEVLEPYFTFHGFQYVEVTGLTAPPTLEAVTGIVVHSDMPRTGTFECSNPLVNQLFHNIIWGQKGNYLEIPTDCPQRDERLGWTGDAQVFMPTAAFNFDVSAFFTKWLADLIQDSQNADGAFACVAPDLHLSYGDTAWADAAVTCTHRFYRVYGDTRIIERHYDALRRYMDYLERTSNDFVRGQGSFGDWLNLGGGAKSEVIGTAYFAHDARLMSEMAAAIGRTDDAKRYVELADKIADSFRRHFVSEDGKILESSQTGYVLALTMGLLTKQMRKAAADNLVEDIRKRDWHLATGFIGTPRLLPALAAAGREDVAYRVLLQETYPSWLYQVKLGATTMWERWDGWIPEKGFQDPGMNSFNHYGFGAVGEYLYSVVAGIDTDGPGFKSIVIRPRPGGGLTYARASYNSVRGLIVSEWKVDKDRFALDVTIPANTTAAVYVPARSAAQVTESGRPAGKAEGVKFLRMEGDSAVFGVGSGSYRFASK